MTEQDPPRTLAQLKFLHGVVFPDILVGLQRLAAEVGEECPLNSVEMVEAAMKHVHLAEKSWRGVPVVPSTPHGRKALSTYTDRCILWASERGIPVRLAGRPEEQPE